MLRQFFPDVRIDNVYQIDFEEYYRVGYRGIICDIDNTFVPHGKRANKKAEALFRRLKEIGFDTVILSNNDKARIDLFNQNIGSKFICDAHKPNPKNFLRATQMMGLTKRQTMVIGDQIFTDIWGANLSGIHSILTKPLRPHEKIQIVLKRIPEKIVLFVYQLQKN